MLVWSNGNARNRLSPARLEVHISAAFDPGHEVD
jgi:hypothetical protein